MTATQLKTREFADMILEAPLEHLEAEPAACLLELIDVAIAHLEAFNTPGNGWRIIRLENMRAAAKKRWEADMGQCFDLT